MDNFSNKTKKLYELNQTIKNIANNFYLFDEIVVISNENRVLDKGFHFSLIKGDDRFIYKDLVSFFDSKKIYQAFKDNKKDIENISTDSTDIFFTGKNDFEFKIGKTFLMNMVQQDVINSYTRARYILDTFSTDNSIELSEAEKTLLLDKNLILCTDNVFKLRVCKELIPTLKVSDKVYLTFKGTIVPNIFEAIIRVEKKDIINYHVYTAINY